MAEKNLKSRIIHKHDIEANWLKAVNFIPKQGELIVYDVDETYTYERFKIGDGNNVVSSLPFITIQSNWNQTDPTKPDYIQNKPGILSASIDNQQFLLTQIGMTYAPFITNGILTIA